MLKYVNYFPYLLLVLCKSFYKEPRSVWLIKWVSSKIVSWKFATKITLKIVYSLKKVSHIQRLTQYRYITDEFEESDRYQTLD